MIIPEMLGFLACPKCQGELFLKDNTLVCKDCQTVFKIENDIPVLLVEKQDA